MKKLFLILFLFTAVQSFAQFSTNVNPWRTLSVSPNYPNVYPRFNTLQAAYTSIKDSAKVSTGKYFTVNIVTSINNITDYSSQWKDSILSRFPYMQLTQFGFGVQDTITGVDNNEFNLIAGIISLKSALAGDGLSFSAHQFHINATAPNIIVNDTFKTLVTLPIYLTPNTIGLKRNIYSGLQVNDSGMRVLARLPFALKGDTLYTMFKGVLKTNADSVFLDFHDKQFVLIGDSIQIDLDTGLITTDGGIAVNVDGIRIGTVNKKITIKNGVAGDGLIWRADSLNVLCALFTEQGGSLNTVLYVRDDSLRFDYNVNHFYADPQGFSLKVDSGLVSDPSIPIQVKLDHTEMSFTSDGEIQTASTLAGNGLVKSGNQINVATNDLATVSADAINIKTAYVQIVFGDSLTTNVTSGGRGILPYDTTGFPVLKAGKVVNTTWTYQNAAGNDTVLNQKNNLSVSEFDKIRAVWVNASSEMRIQRWSLASRTWTTQITLSFPNFANKPWRLDIELYGDN